MHTYLIWKVEIAFGCEECIKEGELPLSAGIVECCVTILENVHVCSGVCMCVACDMVGVGCVMFGVCM